MVRKIEAENFKCFEHIKLEFSNLNMFSGVNSMGKSTLIQLFLLLRQSYEQNALEKGIYLNGRYTNLGVGKDVLYAEAKENKVGTYTKDLTLKNKDALDKYSNYSFTVDEGVFTLQVIQQKRY